MPAYSATAIALIENAEILEEAKAEFRKKSVGGYLCHIEKDAVPMAM